MIRTGRRVRLLSIGLAAMLLMAACSSDGSQAETFAPPATDSSGVATEPTTPPLIGAGGDAAALPTAQPVPSTSPLASGQGCPVGQSGVTATVTGVEEWVRMRSGPAVETVEVGRLDAGATVTAYPGSLSYDGTDFYWVTVVQPASGDCASVAANYLTGPLGTLDHPVPGVSFVAPTTGVWAYSPRTSSDGEIQWSLNDTFLVNATLQVVPGLQIDAQLAQQLAAFEAEGYDYPPDWFEAVVVPGADRAVAISPIISGSGDITSEQLLMEVAGSTIVAGYAVYIEDVDVAPLDELQGYLTSFEINPAAFAAGLQS